MARICIPNHEYKERVQRCAAILRRENLDVLIVNGNEADYANPRYFSGFWPLFERAGVAIAANGDAALMVGPESAIFGADRNQLDKTFVLTAYREGADPSYPELKPDTFHDVFKSIGVSGENLRIGVASFLDTSVTIYNAIREAFPKAELIGAQAQIKCGGFDHAGKWETSLMMGTWPENVDLGRCHLNTEWFSQSAKEASEEIGKHMVACTLEWLRETIQ